MFCDGYINRDGIPTGGQGVAMVTVTAINAALLIAFPYSSGISGSTLLFSNTNINKWSSLAFSGNEAAQSCNPQCHL